MQTRLKNEETEHLRKKLMEESELIEQKNKILSNLKNFFAEHADADKYKNRIQNILLQQIRIENNVNDMKTVFEDIPLDFYNRLQERADNKLTALDLKYCRLIYLKTPPKEMAELLFVDQKTVRVNKYRLKQKLKLTKEDDLNQYIETLIILSNPER